MSAINIYLSPAANVEVACAACRVRKGAAPKDHPMAPIWRVERAAGYYYEVRLQSREGQQAVFYVVPVSTSRCLTGGVSYAGEGGGGLVFDRTQRCFTGVEVDIGATGKPVVTFLFRMASNKDDLYTFTAKFQPV